MPKFAKQRLKTRYLTPIRKKAGMVELGKEDLQYFAKCLVRFVKEEAKKDAAKSSQVPNNAKFFNSFSYVIKQNSVEIHSNWPWIDSIIEGRDAYPMEWLTQEAQGRECVSESEVNAIRRRRRIKIQQKRTLAKVQQGRVAGAGKVGGKIGKSPVAAPSAAANAPPTIAELVSMKNSQAVRKVPLRTRDGRLIIRSMPCTTDKAWIHPAIAKHNFVNRAFERARQACIEKWASKNLTRLLNEQQK